VRIDRNDTQVRLGMGSSACLFVSCGCWLDEVCGAGPLLRRGGELSQRARGWHGRGRWCGALRRAGFGAPLRDRVGGAALAHGCEGVQLIEGLAPAF
jgi:hypothetical protein